MRKIFPLFLALTVLTGCNKETEPTPGLVPVGGVISLRSESVLENEPAAKATTHSERAAGQRLTYTFEAWTRDANPRCVSHRTATGTPAAASIEIALVPGTYDFLFWADYGIGAYTTADLRQIKIAMTPGSTPATYTPGSERDAFACVLLGVQWNGGNGVSATLKRPLAKLTMQNKAAFSTGDKAVSVTYRNVPTQYDVLTEKTSELQTVTVAFPNTTVNSATVGEDFLFVPSNAGQSVGLSITVGDATKRLDALTLQPNHATSVTATFEEADSN